MTEEEAIERLSKLVAADTAPTLSPEELADLIGIGALADSAGHFRGEPEWSPSYDLAIAAAEGWRYKAGAVSDRFRFSQEGEGYDRHQIFEHCLRMAEIYDAKRGTLLVGDVTRAGGAFELVPEGSETHLGLDEERLIRMKRWDGSGSISRVN